MFLPLVTLGVSIGQLEFEFGEELDPEIKMVQQCVRILVHVTCHCMVYCRQICQQLYW